ncbi:MAG: Ig-like domain-containing protein [Ruminococcus sp.]|nr:Ig-like domain-containing protein [Ruminococcus sp.]
MKKSVVLLLATLLISIGASLAGCSSVSVETVILDNSSITLEVGKSATLTATVMPSDVTETVLTWTPSNEEIVTVTDGKVRGVSEGSCTILASASNGITSTCNVTVEVAGPDFERLVVEYSEESWFSYGTDQSYIKVDTNPLNLDSDHLSASSVLAAISGIKEINEELGLPEPLYYKMSETRAIDGTISEEYDKLRVSWHYHLDQGLEVTYEKKTKIASAS